VHPVSGITSDRPSRSGRPVDRRTCHDQVHGATSRCRAFRDCSSWPCPPGIDADLDADGDVELADFLIFQQNFTGSL